MTDFTLPSLGADMDEGMLVGWLVAPGDEVHRGQVVAEVESDKGIIEVECWDEGVVEELLVAPGPQRLRVGTPLARLRTGAAAPPPPVVPTIRAAPQLAAVPAPAGKPRPAATASPATPPVRHLAHRLGVDLGSVVATGPGGRVTGDDVRRAAPHPAGGGRRPVTPRARRLATAAGVDLDAVAPTRADGVVTADDVTRVGVTTGDGRPGPPPSPARDPAGDDRVAAMRRAVARSMARSKREIPHYYLGARIDLAATLAWLDERNAARPVAQRVLPAALLVKATALAAREVPEVNGHWVDDAFHPAAAVHVGVAVSLREGGLVAPAIHDADTLDLDATMEALRDLVGRARSWRLRSSEMSDPTITVTNLGERGVEAVFPVIIPPQVAIVGFGRITDQPVAVDGMLAVHPVVSAGLAADHRVTDGHTGARFLSALDRLLRQPDAL